MPGRVRTRRGGIGCLLSSRKIEKGRVKMESRDRKINKGFCTNEILGSKSDDVSLMAR